MATCHTCGNEYDRAFTLTLHDGQQFVFDSLECAIHEVAPRCEHCDVRIIGHGLQKGDRFFCCDHCAEAEGVRGLEDRV